MVAPTAGRLWDWLIASPADAVTDPDRRTIDLVGLTLPVRASVAVALTIVVLLLDFSRLLVPQAAAGLGLSAETLRLVAVERVVLFALVPLAVVVVAFRDRPSRYGWTSGDAKAGIALSVAGCLAMTPIVLWFATQPDVRAYYAATAAPIGDVLVTNLLDLTAAEFLFRGFLMFTLVRAVGPIGVLIAVMPFAYAHVGKPVLELFSTLGGGLAYGWLAWRTRSILWGSISHAYIVSLVTVMAARS